MSENKIILDLCGGTGAWSKPYKDAGYDVKIITLPQWDLTDENTVKYCINQNPYGILFACDCSVWSNAGVHLWKKRTSDQVFNAAQLLIKGLRIIYSVGPAFWCLENPVGKMKKILGKPQFKFHPYQWGDGYTKYTYLWGKFNMPLFQRSVKILNKKYIKDMPGGSKQKERRAITPPGFAKAFFAANK